jgi:drug/metabolite transporter (DMT)-like permease
MGKAFMGDVTTMAEGGGALIAFGGAVSCSRDSTILATGSDTENTTLIGYAYALASAVAGVAYLVAAKAVRLHMNLYVFMFCVMTIGSLFSFLYASTVHMRMTWNMDIEHGVFGWLNWHFDRLPVEILCNILGGMGYVRCMKYFSNVVISVAALSEPVVAELAAVLIGVGAMPRWQG